MFGSLPCPACPLTSRWYGTCYQEPHRSQTSHLGCADHSPAGTQSISLRDPQLFWWLRLLVPLHKDLLLWEARPNFALPALFSSDLDQEVTYLKWIQDLTHDLQALCIRDHGVKLPSNVEILQGERQRSSGGSSEGILGSSALALSEKPVCTYAQTTFFHSLIISPEENPSILGSLTSSGFLSIYWTSIPSSSHPSTFAISSYHWRATTQP